MTSGSSLDPSEPQLLLAQIRIVFASQGDCQDWDPVRGTFGAVSDPSLKPRLKVNPCSFPNATPKGSSASSTPTAFPSRCPRPAEARKGPRHQAVCWWRREPLWSGLSPHACPSPHLPALQQVSMELIQSGHVCFPLLRRFLLTENFRCLFEFVFGSVRNERTPRGSWAPARCGDNGRGS